MARTCPSCGTEAAFESRTAHVLRGTCPGCGNGFTIVEESTAIAGSPPSGEGASPAEAGGSALPGAPALLCNSCQGAVALRATSPSTLESTCSACGEVVRYTSIVAGGWERPARSPRAVRGPRSRDGDEREDRRGGFASAPSRPCRECGGPLTFNTGEDGTVVGECSSCGNRFTLPPRRDRDSGGRFGGPRYGSRPDARRGGSWGRGPSRGGPPRGPRAGARDGARPRRYGDREERDDGDDRRRRRRFDRR